MKTDLVIDDLFLDQAYRYFLRFYAPVYGDRVREPLDLGVLAGALVEMAGGRPAGIECAVHVFYLPDQPSRFTRRHAEAIRNRIDPGCPEEIPVDGEDLPGLLEKSPVAAFHETSLLALAVSEFASRCAFPVVMADDPVYAVLEECDPLVFVRLGNEETRMPPGVKWMNAAYAFCKAYGVEA